MSLHLPLRSAAVAATLAMASLAASAADFTFTGESDFGAYAGQTFSGSFSFAGSAASADGNLALTAFSMSFGGHTWNLSDLNAGAVAVFATGTPLGLELSADSSNLAVRPSFTLVPGFTAYSDSLLTYTTTDSSGPVLGFGGITTLTDVTPAVPEPTTYALLLAGLGLVGRVAQRARRSA